MYTANGHGVGVCGRRWALRVRPPGRISRAAAVAVVRERFGAAGAFCAAPMTGRRSAADDGGPKPREAGARLSSGLSWYGTAASLTSAAPLLISQALRPYSGAFIKPAQLQRRGNFYGTAAP